MLERITAAAGKAAVLFCAAAAAAALLAEATEILVRRGRVRSKEFSGDIYILKGKNHSKTVFVTNQTPENIVKNVIKSHFGG